MTIAVAHSDSDRGRAALKRAAEEAQYRGEPLAVLRIVPGVDEVTTQDPALNERIAAELADYSNLKWQVHSAPEGFDTAESLLDLAEEVDASLLVIDPGSAPGSANLSSGQLSNGCSWTRRYRSWSSRQLDEGFAASTSAALTLDR
jgi:hypothetical protein